MIEIIKCVRQIRDLPEVLSLFAGKLSDNFLWFYNLSFFIIEFISIKLLSFYSANTYYSKGKK